MLILPMMIVQTPSMKDEKWLKPVAESFFWAFWVLNTFPIVHPVYHEYDLSCAILQ